MIFHEVTFPHPSIPSARAWVDFETRSYQLMACQEGGS